MPKYQSIFFVLGIRHKHFHNIAQKPTFLFRRITGANRIVAVPDEIFKIYHVIGVRGVVIIQKVINGNVEKIRNLFKCCKVRLPLPSFITAISRLDDVKATCNFALR